MSLTWSSLGAEIMHEINMISELREIENAVFLKTNVFLIAKEMCEILSLVKCAKSDSSSVRFKLFSGREIWMRHQLYNNDYLRYG
jgi:hypothetical protein